MEVKSGEGTVVVADRNRYSDECCNNRGLMLKEIRTLLTR
jgi:hypothetical protein